MATINLGNIKFNWQGLYAGGTAYAVDDVVSYNGSSYVCKLASTGNLPTNTTYWDVMSQAGTNGTNGTDLTSTLTTQGDLVYRDGSGLQRLGAGVAGQVLQTGGAGANPSWGSVSSDFVKLAETNVTSATSAVSFDGYFSATYKNYKIFGSGISNGTSNIGINYRIRQSNADVTSAYYRMVADRVRYNGSTLSESLNGNWNDTQVDFVNGMGTTENFCFEMTVYLPTNSTKIKWIQAHAIEDNVSNGYIYLTDHWTTYVGNTNAWSGITFFMDSSDTINLGNFQLYGIK